MYRTSNDWVLPTGSPKNFFVEAKNIFEVTLPVVTQIYMACFSRLKIYGWQGTGRTQESFSLKKKFWGGYLDRTQSISVTSMWTRCANRLAKLCGLERYLPTQTTASQQNTKYPNPYPQPTSPQTENQSTGLYRQLTDTVRYISTLSTYTTITTTLIYKGE
jgi:hypothetical protein